MEIEISVPSDADSPKFKSTSGNAKWFPAKSSIIWTIKSFPVYKGGVDVVFSMI